MKKAGLLDRLRRGFRAATSSPYKTAGFGPRGRRWPGSNTGPNAALDGAAPVLRGQSRDLMRKNALAAAARERIVSNMIGTGIKPKIADAELAATWLKWTDQADAAGVLDFYGVERLVASSLVEAGEVFIRLRNRLPADGLVVPLQLEILEADFVPHDKNERLANGNEIRQGIEFDRVLKSKRVAYWIHPRHPDDGGSATDLNEPVRVPASEVLHVFEPIRPGQVRGEPWLTRVLARLKDLEAYDEAELVRKKTAAMLVGFIRRALPEGMSPEELANVWGDDASTSASDGIGDVALDPGTMQTLLPGEDVEFNAPSDVGGQYEVFMRSQHRAIAAGLGILYEQLTGDYSQVNDRTWRAAVVEFRRRCEGWQHHLIAFQFCRPVWTRWATLAKLARAPGTASLDPAAPVVWVPPAWPYINPVQDVQAGREAVLAGFTSRAAIVAERGEDVAAVDAENAADKARAEDLGLSYSTNPEAAAAPADPFSA